MGIDMPDVEHIVHTSYPKSVISYWQEAGCCTRDGRRGISLILYDNFTASLKIPKKLCHNLLKAQVVLRKKL